MGAIDSGHPEYTWDDPIFKVQESLNLIATYWGVNYNLVEKSEFCQTNPDSMDHVVYFILPSDNLARYSS